MLSFNENIDQFRCNSLDIDCKQIMLSQQKEGGERFEGPGYIWQTSDGTPTFKIYVITTNAKPLEHLDSILSMRAGALHADEMFFDLEAIGRDGTRWTAKRILPAPHWDVSDMSVMVEGKAQSITAHLEPHHQNYLRLHFFEEYRVPLHSMSETEDHGNRYYVLDHADFKACGANFEVRQREGSGDTIIELTSGSVFPEAFDLRV